MADPTTQYAIDVTAGRIVTGRLVRLACERHLKDLETGHERGLWFDVEAAAIAFELWEMCPHLKGEWAARGETLSLESWQHFIIGSAYGWKREDGRRRFVILWIEMARKNAKSTTVYPAILHGMTLDGEAGAEVYSVATKRDQAKLVYSLARRTVVKLPDFEGLIVPFVHHMEAPDTFGRCEPLGADADTLDGLSPSVVIADEVHKWRGRELWDVIETGIGARRQPMFWAITTAGPENSADVYGQEHDYTRQVLEGLIDDDSRFGYIACLDDGDDWTDPANFIKANPNLGVSVQSEEIERQIKKAERSPAAANGIKRLRLGIRTQDADAWIPLAVWGPLADPAAFSWEALAGYPCWGGLDLASTSDFAALSLLFPLAHDLTPAEDVQQPDLWAYTFKLWMPGESRSDKGGKLREIAEPWIYTGAIQATDGNAIDTDLIEAGVKDAARQFELLRLAYDPFNATTVAQHLQAAEIEVAEFQQSMRNYAEPVRVFEEEMLSGRMRHDGNPAVAWMADNVILIEGGGGYRMPSRKRSRNKIDGIMAAIMARAAAMAGPVRPRRSFYDDHEMESF